METSANLESIGEKAKGITAKVAGSISYIWNAVMTALSWIAGCDLAILPLLPSGEVGKKSAIGLTMLFTITVSALAAAYAGTLFLNPEHGWAFGLLWAGVILSIDRAIIVFMDVKHAKNINEGNGNGLLATVATVTGRLAIILCMSYLTSTAVEMLIFESEIEGVVASKRQTLVDKIRTEADSTRAAIALEKVDVAEEVAKVREKHQVYVGQYDARIDSLQASIQHRQDELQLEIQGRVGSGKKGLGPAAQAIYRNIMADSVAMAGLRAERKAMLESSVTQAALSSAEDFATLRIEELDRKLESVDRNEKSELDQVETVVSKGFKDRYLALQSLWDESPLLMWAVFLMLMFIESMPILMKLFSGYGRYEEMLAAQYQQHKVQAMAKQEQDLARLANANLSTLNGLSDKRDGLEQEAVSKTLARIEERAREREDLNLAEANLAKAEDASEDAAFERIISRQERRAKRLERFSKKVERHLDPKQNKVQDPSVRRELDGFLRKVFQPINDWIDKQRKKTVDA